MINQVIIVEKLVADPQVVGKSTKLVVSSYKGKDQKPDYLPFLVPTSVMPPFEIVKGDLVALTGKIVDKVTVVEGVNHHNINVFIFHVSVLTNRQAQQVNRAQAQEPKQETGSVDDLEL